MRYNRLLILYASIYHLFWGVVLLMFGATIPFTASIWLARIVHDYRWQAVALVSVAVFALAGTYWLPLRLKLIRFACLLPQQVVLWLSAFSILAAVAAGHFGDGVLRPRVFIALDQLPGLLLCLFYTAAVLEPVVRIFWHDKVAAR